MISKELAKKLKFQIISGEYFYSEEQKCWCTAMPETLLDELEKALEEEPPEECDHENTDTQDMRMVVCNDCGALVDSWD
jgi:hypothetical protein